MSSAFDVKRALKRVKDTEKAAFFPKFFKTGKGEYAEGDLFWGITVPKTRLVSKQFRQLSLAEVIKLLSDPVHEVRSCGLMIMVLQYPKNPDQIYDIYLANLKAVNNWDLVDGSAPHIVGRHLFDGGNSSLLDELASSKNIWKRRIAMVATQYFLRQGDPKPTLRIARALLSDSHDLIHKASGWMLREMGKLCSVSDLAGFLDQHGDCMPRTMLRYAIERLPKSQQKKYLAMGK